MAVFVAGADESHSDRSNGDFYYGGFVAPELDWSEYFALAWEERVLNTQPPLEYLHVTDLKSAKRRAEIGITEREAERKIDEAFRVIRSQGSLYPIAAHLNEAHFRREMGGVTFIVKTPGGMARKRFDPDYVCFVRFALLTLMYVSESCAGAEKVDFIVEKNGHITDHIKRFDTSLAGVLEKLKRPDLARLVGDIIPGGKQRVPLQAADLLCWYTRNWRTLDRQDARRYLPLARRPGRMSHVEDGWISEMAKEIKRERITEALSVEDDLKAASL